MKQGYPEKVADRVWERDSVQYSYVWNRAPPVDKLAFVDHRNPRRRNDVGYYCGYARFASRPLRERRDGGVLIHAPVHGGITYAEPQLDGSMLYGFDCNHAGDRNNPACYAEDWLVDECERMGEAITMARFFETRVRNASGWTEEELIGDEYVKSLRYHSCFLSYSTADEPAAIALHNELQSRDICCWKWDHELWRGQSLWGELTDAIASCGKFVLICSESSLTNYAVLGELERILQREEKYHRSGAKPRWRGDPGLLIPLRLDNFIFDSWVHSRKADVTKRLVGDFSLWENAGWRLKFLDQFSTELENPLFDRDSRDHSLYLGP